MTPGVILDTSADAGHGDSDMGPQPSSGTRESRPAAHHRFNVAAVVEILVDGGPGQSRRRNHRADALLPTFDARPRLC